MFEISDHEERLAEPVIRTNGHADDDEYAADRARRPDKFDYLRALLHDNVSFHRAFYAIAAERRRGRAAASTLEALVSQLRSGIESLRERDAQRRLTELSRDQVVTACDRALNFKPSIAKAWKPDEAEALVIVWSQLHA
jgi:hypothetical protein